VAALVGRQQPVNDRPLAVRARDVAGHHSVTGSLAASIE